MGDETKKTDPAPESRTVRISWFIPWMAGFMFTVAFCGGVDEIYPLAHNNLIMEIFRTIAVWFLWPLLLGIKLGG